MPATIDEVRFWLEGASRYPLLPPSEILRISKIIQNPATPEQKRQRLLDKLVKHNLKLIPGIVRNLMQRRNGCKYGDTNTIDLLQQGVIGLRRAAEKFDPERGYAFSTYAVFWIRQSIQRGIDTMMMPIRVPESTLRDVFKCIASGDFDDSSRGSRQRERIVDGLRALRCISLDTPADGCNETGDRYEMIASEVQQPKRVTLTFDDIICGVRLSDMQIAVLRKCYMENSTYAQIARELNACRETVRLSASSAIQKIRLAKSL